MENLITENVDNVKYFKISMPEEINQWLTT